jgi:hypothetical protein
MPPRGRATAGPDDKEVAMFRRHCVAASIILSLTGSAGAQTISIHDTHGPRLGGSVSYGGHGLDTEISIDSRTFWKDTQFRATLGQGRWVGIDPTVPPAGTDPTVTRTGVSIIKNGPFDPYAPVRYYGGVGLGVLIPRGVDMRAVAGFHALLGIEAVGDRWSFGPELQLDGPIRNRNRFIAVTPGTYLSPTARIGFFARRRL